MPDLAGMKVAYLGFCGLIDSNGATRLATTINTAVNEGYDSVHLCFSSPGGYVGDGIFLYHHIRSLPIGNCSPWGNRPISGIGSARESLIREAASENT